jgi:hypothetical protein
MHTVVTSPSLPFVVKLLIKKIYSKFRNTKKLRPHMEIEPDWPNISNDKLLSLDYLRPTQEHCIGLCRSPSYRSGREKALYLSGILPFNWETIKRVILNHRLYPDKGSEADINMWGALLHTEVKIGSGVKITNMDINDGHIMIRIVTDLPIDKNFIVHGCWQERLSSQQSQCWHMSQTLESDCDELMRRMRKLLTYNRIDCPEWYDWTDVRMCPSCPLEYVARIYRAAAEEEEVCGDEEEYYPYYIQFIRWVDLGEMAQECESEEFKALTAGQVCCNHLERARKPPIDCLWQGRDWSIIPSIHERAERLTSIGGRAWNRFLYWIAS